MEAKHDVLVVGAGCAGMRAAIEAFDAGADVAIVSKLHPTRSHSGSAEGGINAALGNLPSRPSAWRYAMNALLVGYARCSTDSKTSPPSATV